MPIAMTKIKTLIEWDAPIESHSFAHLQNRECLGHLKIVPSWGATWRASRGAETGYSVSVGEQQSN
jgi:hypothetical protein